MNRTIATPQGPCRLEILGRTRFGPPILWARMFAPNGSRHSLMATSAARVHAHWTGFVGYYGGPVAERDATVRVRRLTPAQVMHIQTAPHTAWSSHDCTADDALAAVTGGASYVEGPVWALAAIAESLDSDALYAHMEEDINAADCPPHLLDHAVANMRACCERAARKISRAIDQAGRDHLDQLMTQITEALSAKEDR